jgi:hypothetical protein
MVILKILSGDKYAENDPHKAFKLITDVVQVDFARQPGNVCLAYILRAGSTRPVAWPIHGDVIVMDESWTEKCRFQVKLT